MRVTAILQFVLVGVWMRVAVCTGVHHAGLWSEPEFDQEKRGLEARAGTNNMHRWDVQGQVQASHQHPTFRSFQTTAIGGFGELRKKAEDGYKSVKSLREEMRRTLPQALRPRPVTRGDLTATLYVPGKGTYSASLPKGAVRAMILGNMATRAPALHRNRGTQGGELHVEDAVIYYFEIQNPTYLTERADRFPPGTLIAIFGRTDVNSSEDEDKEEKKRGPCMQCHITLRNLGITAVPAT